MATAPALIVVGASMLTGLGRVQWDDPREAVPAFLCATAMPLTFSIANGIAIGIVAWAAIHGLSGRARRVPPLLWLLAALILVRYAWLAGG